jgi:hypothetical protein
MGALAVLVEFLERREQRERMADFLADRRLQDLASPDFALTPRTRRLQCWGNNGKRESPCPFVLFHAVPETLKERAWSLSDDQVWNWLDPGQRRYEPWKGGFFLPSARTATTGGIIFEGGTREDGGRLDHYVVVEVGGVVEIGLAGTTVAIHDKQVGFSLLPIIGTIWRLLMFVPEFYNQVELTSSFTLIVSVRTSQDSVLGGLARGWRDPWPDRPGLGLFCREPALRFVYPSIQPNTDNSSFRFDLWRPNNAKR